MIRFLTESKMDAATLTSLSVNASFPLANIIDTKLKKTYRTTGLLNEWIKFDLGGAEQLLSFCFFYSNLTPSATITLYGSATDLGNTEASWAGAAYSQVITDFDQRAGFLDLSQTYQWWMLAISDSANTSGYIELGRIFAGVHVSPEDNISESLREGLVDSSIVNFTQGRSAYGTTREKFKQFSFDFTDIDSDDQQTLRDLFNEVGKTEPFVIIFDSDVEPVELTRYGLFTSDLEFSSTPNYRANCALSFVELR